jgi:RNA polymerase sigma factor (sigma-70 family)
VDAPVPAETIVPAPMAAAAAAVDVSRSGPEVVERDPQTPEVLRVLTANHSRFLDFVERRVESRDHAEDILQEAFVRSLGHTPPENSASATAWFYRVLRNAITDHYRRRGTQERALDRYSVEAGSASENEDAELESVVCACVTELVGTLKEEYATALRRVDLGGLSVRQFAVEAGITPGNAGVRLHRAREALRRQLARSCGTCLTHGCFDCQCQN